MGLDVKFDRGVADKILKIFGKDTDEEGYIIEKSSNERVLTQQGNPVKKDNLGMIAKGSEVFVEDNFVSKLNYVKNKGK